MKTKAPKVKWDDKFYIVIYQLACNGLTDQQIAQALGTNAFHRWKKLDSTVKFALEEGRNGRTRGADTLSDHIYGRLPRKLRKLYNNITRVIKEPNGVRRVNMLFANHGELAKKELFLYALTRTHFDPSRAMRRIGLPFRLLKTWIEDDRRFGQLVDEIQEHKKNFCEGKLLELVKEKDAQVVMFVNRTLNRDRGYGDEVKIKHEGEIQHKHTQLIDVTALPLKIQKIVLEALDKQEKETEKEGLLLEDRRDQDVA